MRKLLVSSCFLAAALAAAVFMFASFGPRATAQGSDTLEARPAVSPGSPVPQPIAFSHEIHAGQVGMDCLYCHVGADDGPVATIPAVETCMGCHKMVKTQSPEVQKLRAYWENRQPIPWVKVHDLADHARFDHGRHVKAGITCQTCHGPVETMDEVRLQQDLIMGWCVDCHKARLNETDHPTSLDCWTCHK